MPSLAVLGAAHVHAPEFLDLLDDHGGVRLAGVFDDDDARARATAERAGVPVLAGPAEALDDPAVDAVMITSETVRHRDLAVAAARAGKAIFVEKPVGVGAADARAIADAVRTAGVVFQTGYFLRGDPRHQVLRDLVRGGELGRLTRVRVHNANPSILLGWLDEAAWMADPARSGVGAWGDEGAHAVDLLRWLTGREVARVVLATRAGLDGRFGDVDETGEALLVLDDGVLATVGAGWVEGGDPVEVEAWGTDGHAWVAGRRLHRAGGTPGEDDEGEEVADLPSDAPHAFTLFLDVVCGREPALPLVDAADAAATTAVLEAAYASRESGAWVDVL